MDRLLQSPAFSLTNTDFEVERSPRYRRDIPGRLQAHGMEYGNNRIVFTHLIALG